MLPPPAVTGPEIVWLELIDGEMESREPGEEGVCGEVCVWRDWGRGVGGGRHKTLFNNAEGKCSKFVQIIEITTILAHACLQKLFKQRES